jgi:hypothetical protein
MVVPYPALVKYPSIGEYRKHYERVYCQGPVVTFDGIPVRFRKNTFDHAFFESTHSKDDTFSKKRAERIDWIKAALEDPHSERYVGWDNRRKRYDRRRRVTVVMGDYVVVIELTRKDTALFRTAFVADSGRTLNLIRQSPCWK